MAILGDTGPMGLGAIDYVLHGPVRPSLLVVTDINTERLTRAENIFSLAFQIRGKSTENDRSPKFLRSKKTSAVPGKWSRL